MIEDVDLTEEDRRAVAISLDYFQQNPDGGISLNQMAAECGFTMDQIRSGSMGGRLGAPRLAVEQFLHAADPRDEFFLVTFSDEAELVAGSPATPRRFRTN